MKPLLIAVALPLLAPSLLVAAPVAAQSSADDARFRAAQERFDREYQIYREAVERYQATRGEYGYRDPAPRDPAAGNGRYRRAPDISAGRTDTDDRDYQPSVDDDRYPPAPDDEY
jgi:hypothetical protein